MSGKLYIITSLVNATVKLIALFSACSITTGNGIYSNN